MTRRPLKADDKKPNSNAAALQGATLAFAAQGKKKNNNNNNINGKIEDTNGHRINIPAGIPPRTPKTNGARKAALFANAASNQSIDNTQDSDESISSSAAGTVRDRIQLFSDSDLPDTRVPQAGAARDTQNRDKKPSVRTDPQHIAAQLAVDRSKTPVPSTQIASSKAVRTMGRLEPNTTGPNNQDINLNSSTSIFVRAEHRNDTTFMESPADRRPIPPKPRDRITSDLVPEKKETSMASESSPSQRRVAARVASRGGPTPTPAPASPQTSSRPPVPPKPQLSPPTARNAVTAIAEKPPPPPPRPVTANRPSSLVGSQMAAVRTPRPQQLVTQQSRSSLRPQHSGMSESSRADAITASSIATSRSPSPAKRNTPPPPPPHRRSRSRSRLHLHPTHNILDRNTLNAARNVSPAKSTASTTTTSTVTGTGPSTAMRRTMRPKRTDEEDELKNRNHHHRLKIRSHPHKHREGDRKRWRDRVSERERKRYEGVWAANKGLWITPDEQVNLLNKSLQLEDMVISMVVRDIWSRSRLPRTVLEQIWNLVSGDGRALLSKEEFVVGMWLIDQSLKGRKLPVKVSQSVWDGVTAGGNWRSTPIMTPNTTTAEE